MVVVRPLLRRNLVASLEATDLVLPCMGMCVIAELRRGGGGPR